MTSTGKCVAEPDMIGPMLPAGLAPRSNSPSSDTTAAEDSGENLYGPALPPGYRKQDAERPIIGPALPPGLASGTLAADDDSSSDSEGVIGPLPPVDGETAGSTVCDEFERRAVRMKKKLTEGEDKNLKREEWMTVLPPEMGKNFGLGPRSFLRQTPVPSGDRSVWTETPHSQKNAKAEETSDDLQKGDDDEMKNLALQKYNTEMNERVKEHNKSSKRTKSLLDIHQKALKKKKREEKDKPKERRPFDRDIDLKANQLDNAKRNALIKQSAQLNDKFSHGKGQFL